MSKSDEPAKFNAPWDLMIDHLTGIIVHAESYTEFFLLPEGSTMLGREVVPAKQNTDKPVDFL